MQPEAEPIAQADSIFLREALAIVLDARRADMAQGFDLTANLGLPAAFLPNKAAGRLQTAALTRVGTHRTDPEAMALLPAYARAAAALLAEIERQIALRASLSATTKPET